MEFTKEDLRKLIYFCWKDNMNSVEIMTKINTVLEGEIVNERTCRRWIARFKQDDYSVQDKSREGRPLIDLSDNIENALNEDPFATSRQIAERIGICHMTVLNRLKAMGKSYRVNAWLPHNLTNENKAARERICGDLLNMFEENNFLPRLITVDETWIYWDTKKSYHNRSWYGTGDSIPGCVSQQLTSRKHLLSVFWDSKGVISMQVLPRNQTLNSNVYCEQLEQLRLDIQTKRRRLFGNNQHLYFLQDNAKPHVARQSLLKISAVGLTTIPHPAYSPDLSPSDFYLFSPLKNALRNKVYNSVDEIQLDVIRWINSKDKKFFQAAFDCLPSRWRRCVECGGDYFEKEHPHDGLM